MALSQSSPPFTSMQFFFALLCPKRAIAPATAVSPIQGLERRFGLLNLSVSHAGVECSLLIDPRR